MQVSDPVFQSNVSQVVTKSIALMCDPPVTAINERQMTQNIESYSDLSRSSLNEKRAKEITGQSISPN